MTLQIKQLTDTKHKPSYGTGQSVGIDLYVVGTHVIRSGKSWKLPLGVVVKPPEGCFTMIAPRGSTFEKTGLILVNSIGIVDPDYCGPNDQLFAHVFNPTSRRAEIKDGDKLFQLLVFPAMRPEIELTSSDGADLAEEDRGGFGSTDGVQRTASPSKTENTKLDSAPKTPNTGSRGDDGVGNVRARTAKESGTSKDGSGDVRTGTGGTAGQRKS